MNLKRHLLDIFGWVKNNRTKSIAGTAILLVVVLIGMLCVYHSNQQHAEQERIAREAILRKEQEDRYTSLCLSLNAAIDKYNHTVEIINGFLTKIEAYHVLNKTDPLLKKLPVEVDFETFNLDGADFSRITKETERISCLTNGLEKQYVELCHVAYQGAIDTYNVLAEAYNALVTTTSIDFISNLPESVMPKDIPPLDANTDNIQEDNLVNEIADIVSDTDNLAAYYRIVNQITNPDEQWVIERLANVSSIIGFQSVTLTDDPNGLLGKEGGYTSCTYFSSKGINQDSIPGSNIIAKGTDAGGAIEVYPTLETAKNRCDYLSQFDNTLLYSGSYAIVGTMVIRTSYIYTTQEQIDLTNEIISAFTEVRQGIE